MPNLNKEKLATRLKSPVELNVFYFESIFRYPNYNFSLIVIL